MDRALARLLRHRLLIVSGKGGAGKTALVAALGLVAAEQGVRTVVVELGKERRLLRLLAPNPVEPGDGRAPVRVRPGLSLLSLDPFVALTEYLELQLKLPFLVRSVIENRGMRSLLEAAPGWRELITLGKLWHLQSGRDASGLGSPELLIVDAPASGHGVALLSTPRVVIDTVRLGPLRRNTDRVQELLLDPERTRVLPVTLPEELSVRETIELCQALNKLGIATGPIFANAVETAPPELDTLGLDTLENVPLGVVPSASLEACRLDAQMRATHQRGFLSALRAELTEPVLELPFLTTGVETPDQAATLAQHLRRVCSRSEAGR